MCQSPPRSGLQVFPASTKGHVPLVGHASPLGEHTSAATSNVDEDTCCYLLHLLGTRLCEFRPAKRHHLAELPHNCNKQKTHLESSRFQKAQLLRHNCQLDSNVKALLTPRQPLDRTKQSLQTKKTMRSICAFLQHTPHPYETAST